MSNSNSIFKNSNPSQSELEKRLENAIAKRKQLAQSCPDYLVMFFRGNEDETDPKDKRPAILKARLYRLRLEFEYYQKLLHFFPNDNRLDYDHETTQKWIQKFHTAIDQDLKNFVDKEAKRSQQRKEQKEFENEMAEQEDSRFQAHFDNIEKKSQSWRDLNSKLDSGFLNIKKEWFGDLQTMPNIDHIKGNFAWLSFVTWIALIPISCFKMAHAAAISTEPLPTRVFNFTMGTLGLAVSIIGLIAMAGAIAVATPILITISAAKAVVESLWGLGTAVYKRVFAEGKENKNRIKKLEEDYQNASNAEDKKRIITELTAVINKQKDLNAEIAKKTHYLAQSATALTASILLFTPAFMVGAFMLVGIAAYGLADVAALPQRALQFLASKSKFVAGLLKPFRHSTEEEVELELKKKLSKGMSFSEIPEDEDDESKVVRNSEAKVFTGITHSKEEAESVAKQESMPHIAPVVVVESVAPIVRESGKDLKEKQKDGEGEAPHHTIK